MEFGTAGHMEENSTHNPGVHKYLEYKAKIIYNMCHEKGTENVMLHLF